MIDTIHLVLYSNGNPFDDTKIKIMKSASNYTKYNLVIHDYTLDKIKSKPWFSKIEPLSLINRQGRRDGYYCAYKIFCCLDVYELMGEDDILYYTDCSQYFINGFTECFDKICEITKEKGIIAGSIGKDTLNNTRSCADNMDVWKKILPDIDESILEKPHILASWFLMAKRPENEIFLNEWAYFSLYSDTELTLPLITYNHPADQVIFNILIHKYKFPIFYREDIKHDWNKDKNIVLKTVNEADDFEKYFIYL